MLVVESTVESTWSKGVFVGDKSSKLDNNHVALKEAPKPLPVGYIVAAINGTHTYDLDYKSVCGRLKDIKAAGGSVMFFEPSEFYRKKSKWAAGQGNLSTSVEMSSLARKEVPVVDQSNITVL